MIKSSIIIEAKRKVTVGGGGGNILPRAKSLGYKGKEFQRNFGVFRKNLGEFQGILANLRGI